MDIKYVDSSRNTHKGLSKLLQNIFDLMIVYNQSIFKLLTFDEVNIIDHKDDENYNPLEHSEMDIEGKNLTREQKTALLFKTGDHAEEYRVQFQRFADDALTNSQCRLHMYIDKVIPKNAYISQVDICFEILCHNKYNPIDGGHRNRIECIYEELLNFLGGLYIEDACGELFFDNKASNGRDMITSNLSNSKNILGGTLTMSCLFASNENKAETR